MLVYNIKHKRFGSSMVCDEEKDALGEISSYLRCGVAEENDEITLKIVDITQEELDDLPEFRGY